MIFSCNIPSVTNDNINKNSKYKKFNTIAINGASSSFNRDEGIILNQPAHAIYMNIVTIKM
jgi:hypothetical protein